MALIHCPECGKEISDRVVSCPHCGFPLQESKEDSSRRMLADSALETLQFEEAQRLYTELLLTSPNSQELKYLKAFSVVRQLNPDIMPAQPCEAWLNAARTYLASESDSIDVKKQIIHHTSELLGNALDLAANKYNQLLQSRKNTAMRNLFLRPVWNQDFNANDNYETYRPKFINYMWSLSYICGEILNAMNVKSGDVSGDSAFMTDYGNLLKYGVNCCNNLIAQKSGVVAEVRKKVDAYKQEFERLQKEIQ